jgi:(p)ppGpp synthase/HD superfamily hydrolase
MSTLERAIAIAAEAHAGTCDKAGEPYIFHPLRVMFALVTAQERIVGVMHDVVEKNSAWPLEVLATEGFSPAVLTAVDAVTRRKNEDEEAFIRRAADNEIGRRVKLADISDNMRQLTLKATDPTSEERIAKYRKFEAILLAWPLPPDNL